MSESVHATIEQLLRRSRQRYTPGRRQLVEAMLATGGPSSLTDLVEEGAEQSQSSLYRNLAVLEQCGAVHRLTSVDDTARFELAEALTEHHHHIVCASCGRIDDITLPADIEHAIERAHVQAEARGFTVTGHHLELEGRCDACV